MAHPVVLRDPVDLDIEHVVDDDPRWKFNNFISVEFINMQTPRGTPILVEVPNTYAVKPPRKAEDCYNCIGHAFNTWNSDDNVRAGDIISQKSVWTMLVANEGIAETVLAMNTFYRRPVKGDVVVWWDTKNGQALEPRFTAHAAILDTVEISADIQTNGRPVEMLETHRKILGGSWCSTKNGNHSPERMKLEDVRALDICKGKLFTVHHLV